MNDNNALLIPVIYKDFVGKPKRGGMGLGFDGSEQVSWRTIEQVAYHCWGVAVEGELLINGNYDINRWKAEGSVKTARQERYFLSSRLMVIDVDDGLPPGTPTETIDYLLESSEIVRNHAGAIFPSSRFQIVKPKIHILFALNELIEDWYEYKELHGRLRNALPFKSDPAMQTPTQPLYGTRSPYNEFESDIYTEENRVLSVEYLRSLPETEKQRKTKTRRQRLEREGAKQHNAAKTNGRQLNRALMLVRFILENYPGKMSNETWYQFRLAAQAASGNSMIVFDEIAASAYWQRWGEDWDIEAERYRWEGEAPHSVTVGTLYAMASELGWGTANRAEITPDHEIDDLSELPLGESYLLRAFTGLGKSQAQRATIEQVLEAGKKVCWQVPTKSLAASAALDFADLGAQAYLDEEGKIREGGELQTARFIVTTPQTFASRIAVGGLEDYGLIVLDEVQQIADAVFEPDNALWKKEPWRLKAYLKAIETAKRTPGLILRGLDAGLARGACEWLGLPVYDCAKTLDKASVIISDNESTWLDTLAAAVGEEDKLVYVTCDTKAKSDQLATWIRGQYPEKRTLLVNGKTCSDKAGRDPEAVAFMRDPNGQVSKWDVLIVSPSMLTGVSIVAREAVYVFQHCANLPPKSNLQMLNRFRRQGKVFVYYQGMRGVGDVLTPEAAEQRASVLMSHVAAYVARSEAAKRYEVVRYWCELDRLYQSFEPQAYYEQLLEREGRSVTVDADTQGSYRLAKTEDNEAHEWALNHWHEVSEYDPLRSYPDVDEKTEQAMLMHREINRKTEGGHKYAEDKRRLALAAEQFKRHQLATVETVMGLRERNAHIEQLAADEDTPDSHLKADDQMVLLLNWSLRILDYRGAESISASVFVERGKELVAFLSKHKEDWDAVFPTAKHLELSGDDIADARSLLKDLLALTGLRARRGKKTSIINPVSGARLYDLDINGIDALKELLLLRACGREKKALPAGIEWVFPEMAYEARSQADLLAAEWYEEQRADVREAVRRQMWLCRETWAAACLTIKESLEDETPF